MKLHPFDGRRPIAVELLRMAATVWLAVAGILWAIQEILIYPGVLSTRVQPEVRSEHARIAGIDEVVLHGEDGAEIVLWHVPVDGSRAVLLFHGNGTALEQNASWVHDYVERGYDVVCAEYRGFDGVPGWPTEAGLVADARVVWNWIHDDLGLPADRVLIHGESLGGGVASALAADVHPAGVVLVSTFDSLETIAANRIWYLPVHWMLRTRFPSAERLADAGVDAFVAHARDDTVVPFPRGEALAAAIPGAKFFPIEGTQHGGLTILDPGVHEAWAAWVDARAR